MAEHDRTRSQASYESAALPLSYWPATASTVEGNASASPEKYDSDGGKVGQALLALVARLLTYDPDTGVLAWKVARRKCRVGSPAGSLTDEGYVRVDLTGRTLAGHRIAWMLQTGTMPPDRIDHINGDRADNRWRNLRAATATENAWNSERSANATGVWRRYGKIYGRIRHDGKVISAGPFASEAECTAWYQGKLATLRGAFSPLVARMALPLAVALAGWV